MEDDRYDVKATIGQLGAHVSQQNERLGRVETTLAALTERVGRVEISLAEIKALLLATLPHLATKAVLAEVRTELLTQINEKPSKTYMWGVLAVLLTAYTCGLAAVAILK